MLLGGVVGGMRGRGVCSGKRVPSCNDQWKERVGNDVVRASNAAKRVTDAPTLDNLHTRVLSFSSVASQRAQYNNNLVPFATLDRPVGAFEARTLAIPPPHPHKAAVGSFIAIRDIKTKINRLRRIPQV